MIHIIIRGYIGGVKHIEEHFAGPDNGDGLDALAEKHALALLDLPGGDKHMIEVEFLDEPDPKQRFFRFGTDPKRMHWPQAVDLFPRDQS